MPGTIRFVSALPRPEVRATPPRRILRKVAVGDLTNLGDASALADPKVLDELLAAPADA